jgi:alcohol dehydrogenase
MIRFFLSTDLTIQNGAFREIPGFIRSKGFGRPAFLVDEGFANSTLWQEVAPRIKAEFGPETFILLARGTAEPTYHYVEQVVEAFRSQACDVVIGVGGGSCMDIAKAAAALKTNPGRPLEYRGFDKLRHPGVATILVPTTAGTGSEVTINASFVDTDGKKKLGINGRFMQATHAILDAETTLSCPYQAAVGAGLDAMVHTLEAFVCRQRNQVTKLFAREAFRLLYAALPCLKDDPSNLDKRLDLLLGAYYGAIAMFNSGSGIAAAISYPLSVYYGVPHGMGGAMTCVEVIRYNIRYGCYDYSELAPLAGIPNTNSPAKERAEGVCARLQALWDYLGVPKDFSAFGICADRFSHILEVMKTQQPGFDQNPIPFAVEKDLAAFLERFFESGNEQAWRDRGVAVERPASLAAT